MKDYDLVVIGGGSGGIAAARRAAKHGAKVAVVEAGRLGGTCVNVGCVPKKVMWNAAGVADAINGASGYGFQPATAELDWGKLKARRDAFIERLNGIYEKNLAADGIDIIEGRGAFRGPRTVAVNGRELCANHVLIAVGGWPSTPDTPGSELGITSDGFFELETQPKRIAIVGAGYIAVELAGMLHALGSEVTLIIRRDQVLRSFDPALSETLMAAMTQHGPRIIKSCTLTAVERASDGSLTLRAGNSVHSGFDTLLWAIGRQPSTAGLGLESCGVAQRADGTIQVDQWQNTTVSGVYAVGDVTGARELTPVAIAAGRKWADRVFGGEESARLEYENIPSVVFSHPPIATIGMTEPEARATHGDAVKVYQSKFTDLYFSMMEDKLPSVVKVVVSGPEERVLGIHIIGRGADEIMQGFGVAVRMGATKADLDRCVAIHPSAAEEVVTLR